MSGPDTPAVPATPAPAGKPHFGQIARHLTEAIGTGHFAVGALLPTELELCEHYGTSRHTVRAALAELQQLGLVSRRKNVGTRVIAATPRSSFRPTLASVDDLVQYGAEHHRAVQSVGPVVASGVLAEELGCPDGTPWVRVSSLRRIGDEGSQPIGWTDVYVDPRYQDVAEQVHNSPGVLISTMIETRHGRRIAAIHQDVRAFLIDDEAIALALGERPGSPGLKIVRRYLDEAGAMFEASITVHPANRFALSMRMERSA